MSSQAHRTIYNTIILNGRMVISVILGLISTRLVLSALGEVDFGIYALVAGVVASLSFLNSAMSASSIRYIAHSMGNSDPLVLHRTFVTTVLIHLIVGLIVLLLIEVGGYFMFEYLLKIPVERFYAAKVVFHLMAVSTFIVIISVPYDALISANEDFLWLSVIEISAVLIKVVIAIAIWYYSSDRLILYAILMAINQFITRLAKQVFTNNRYKKIKINFKEYTDKLLLQEILSFTGWNLFGSLCAIGSKHVSALIINMFFNSINSK